MPGLQAGDARVEDRRGRHKVRLADAERHHVVHGGGDVKIAANAGRRHGLHAPADTRGVVAQQPRRGEMAVGRLDEGRFGYAKQVRNRWIWHGIGPSGRKFRAMVPSAWLHCALNWHSSTGIGGPLSTLLMARRRRTCKSAGKSRSQPARRRACRLPAHCAGQPSQAVSTPGREVAHPGSLHALSLPAPPTQACDHARRSCARRHRRRAGSPLRPGAAPSTASRSAGCPGRSRTAR